MARTVEQSLDYFPMDSGIFSDRKIRKLLKTFDAKGYLIYNFVLCEIYKDKGYFVKCDKDFMFDVADTLKKEDSLVKEVIEFCVNNELFDKRVYDVYSVLTSRGIQKRYRDVKKRSSVVIKEMYKISEEKIINVTEKAINETLMQINVTEKPINETLMRQRKEKESKVNKIKEKEINKEKFLNLNFDFLNSNPEFLILLKKWIEYKKQKNNPITSQIQIEIFYKELFEMSSGNVSDAERIMNWNISKGYQAIYQPEPKFINYGKATNNTTHNCRQAIEKGTYGEL